ncbi:MAG: hypothetical protein ILP02_00320 [Clostridia bacterium]|nr:hypothetical protein [Clostridia bacterium]
MEKKTAFIGHRNVFFAQVKGRLQAAVERQIASGCKVFTMGTHGEFDEMALSACRAARAIHPDIRIEVVLTSYHIIEKKDEEGHAPYRDVDTVMYETEELHFKRRIAAANEKMIDGCDALICYVNEKKTPSGARSVMNYAKRKGLMIVNLFDETDDPMFGMTAEEKEEYRKAIFSKKD